MENDFFKTFFETTSFPSFYLTNVDDLSLERYRKVITKVKEKTKSNNISISYDVLKQKLTITGTAIDLFYFGYYTRDLK